MLNTKYMINDLYGGITAAIVALPLALAFGVQSGMGAIAGLYGAIALGFFAALFGGTSTQISGPTGPMTVVSSAIIAGEIAVYGSVEAAMGTIVATFVLAGVFLVIMGFTKIGQYIRYIPYPVVSGFMSGIGLIIIIMQIFPFFGMKSPSSIVDIFSNLSEIKNGCNLHAVILSILTMAVIYLFPKLTKAVPSTLVALLVLSSVAYLLNMDVAIIGDIPKGLPDVHIDTLLEMDWHHPMVMVIPALTLAALGAIDSLLTSVIADNMTKTKHNPNKELIGQGIGNMVAGIIGGLPGAGATMRTVVNIRAGGKTRLSGMIHSLVLLIILLGAGAYAKLIPIPVLAGILITVGIGIIDYKGLKHLVRVPRADAFVMITVLVLTVFVDLLQAVAVGLVLASLLFMKHMGDIAQANATCTILDEFHDPHIEQEKKVLPQELQKQVFIQHFDGPIFFGFTEHFKSMIEKLPDVHIVLFMMDNVPSIDQTGMYAIEDAVLELKKRGITVVFTGIKEQPSDMLKNIRLIPDLVSQEYIYDSYQEAIKNLKSYVS